MEAPREIGTRTPVETAGRPARGPRPKPDLSRLRRQLPTIAPVGCPGARPPERDNRRDPRIQPKPSLPRSPPTSKVADPAMTTNQDQGRLARMFAFWSAVFLLIFGCHFVFQQLFVHVPGFQDPLGGLVVPIVNIKVNWAFLVGLTLFAIGFVWINRWQNRPQVAGFLADTESELRKVSWPTWSEVVNSSTVVVVCVLVLMGFLAVVDLLLARVFSRLFLS